MDETDAALRRVCWRLGLTAAAVALFLDQASKWWILKGVMAPPRTIEVTGFFNIVLAWNRGISFGLFSTDVDATRWLFAAFAVAVSVGLLVWLHRTEQRLPALGLGVIVGGALGNAFDRVRHGAVVDFLDLHWAGYHWPAFNIADSAITVGVALLLYDALFQGRRSLK